MRQTTWEVSAKKAWQKDMATITVPKVNNALRDDIIFREATYIFARDVKEILDFCRKPNPSHYEMVRIAGVVGRLFIDKHSLAVTIASQLRLKIWVIRYLHHGDRTKKRLADLDEIYIATAPKKPEKLPMMPHDNFDVVHTLDQYLKTSNNIIGRIHVTSKQIILLYANKLGGVHFDPKFLRSNSVLDEIYSHLYLSSTSIKVLGQFPSAMVLKEVVK